MTSSSEKNAALRAQVADLAAQGLHSAAIARQLGTAHTNVCRWAAAQGIVLPPRPARVLDEERIAQWRGEDLSGQTFGELQVQRPAGLRGHDMYWWCLCSCGKEVLVVGHHLCGPKDGWRKRSCGHERACLPQLKRAHPREYTLWIILCRRGVCPRWQQFDQFLADVSPCPPDRILIRVDKTQPYGPTNCKLVTRAAFQRERYQRQHAAGALPAGWRAPQLVEYEGGCYTISELAEAAGIRATTVWQRLHHGWPLDEALATPLIAPPVVVVQIEGQPHALRDLAKALGLRWSTVYSRLRRGASLERVLGPLIDRRIEFEGERHSIRELACAAGLGYSTVLARLQAHWSLERALRTPVEQADLEGGLRAAETELLRLAGQHEDE